MTTMATTNFQSQLTDLRDKHTTFRETYYCQEMEKGPFKDIIDLTNETFVFAERTVNKLKDIELELDTTKAELVATNIKINEMSVLLTATATALENEKSRTNNMDIRMNEMSVLLTATATALENEKSRTKILKTFRDWLSKFFDNLIHKLGKQKWHDVETAITDYCYNDIDVSNYESVIELSRILSEVNVDFEGFVLLYEMKKISNETFHRGWVKVEEAKEQLNQQFPDDLEKFRVPLQNLFSSTNIWFAWAGHRSGRNYV